MHWYEKGNSESESVNLAIALVHTTLSRKLPPLCPAAITLPQVNIDAKITNGFAVLTCNGKYMDICHRCRIHKQPIYINPDNVAILQDIRHENFFSEKNGPYGRDIIGRILLTPEQQAKLDE